MNRKTVLKRLASLNLAVFVIISIGVIAAVGTIYEARYDADVASQVVYRSVWMYLVLSLLSINLIAVMVDRWPWKVKHVGFVLAHIGIIVLLIGGLITQYYGVDGSMYFEIGTHSRWVTIADKELSVYSTFDGNRFTDLLHRDVNFLKYPAKENRITIPVMDGNIEVVDSLNFAQFSERIVASENPLDGGGIRFQLHNNRVNELQWLVQSREGKIAVSEFGPLRLVLGSIQSVAPGSNVLALEATSEKDLKYAVYKKEDEKPVKVGTTKEGDELDLPWMGLKFKVLRFLNKAHREWEVKEMPKPSAMTTSAILVSYKDQKHWVQLNDIVRFFTPAGAYIVKYGQKRVDIGEEFLLKKFSVGRYQGTRRAMSYESVVDVPQLGERLISMNEPLKFNGYTFYQSSFQENPQTGEPTASILSVNKDPGRAIKYIGSLIIVLGIIHLFWFKQRQKKTAKSA